MHLKFFIQSLILFSVHIIGFANEPTLEKVTLQLQWKHQFEFAGFYMAKEKGFYADVGLDVTFLEFHKSTNIVDTVLSKKVDYGLGYSSIIADYFNGKDIVFIANFFKESPLVLVTQKNITSLSQLRGSRIEVLANNIDNIIFYTMLEKFDILKQDIKVLKPTFGIDQFANKNIDAMSAFTTNELYLLNIAGVQYNVFYPASYGAKYYDANLFTSKEELLKNPKRVENFKNASIKGWIYALENIEETMDIVFKKYNTQNKTKDALFFEAKQIEQIMLPKVHAIGSIDLERVQMIAESFQQSEFIKVDKKLDVRKLIYKEQKKDKILTEKDIKYLKEKKHITACVDPNWMPFAGIIDEKYKGIDANFLDLFEEKLGFPIEIYPTRSWSQSVKYAKEKRCDILSMIVKTKERENFLNYTDAYFYFANVLVTTMDKAILTDMKDLKNQKIAIVKDYAEIELIRSSYNNIEIVEVNSMKEGLQKVANSEVYGFVDNAFTVDYYFHKEENLYFKIGSYFNEKRSLHLGIRDDDLQLHSIMQKLVQSITLEEKNTIRNRWLGLKYDKPFNYNRLYQFLGLLCLVLMFIVMRMYYVKKTNIELKKRVQEELINSKKKDKLIFHQSKLAAMGEMIENIAHQWRQPLSQVNSCVLVIDDVLEEKEIKNSVIEEKLLEIESLTKYMSHTIEDFKNFFDKTKEKSDFNLKEIIDKSLQVLSGRIEDHKISIIWKVTQKYKYKGYPSELQQAIIILLNNAIDVIVHKEIKNGEISIDIESLNDEYIITINDNAGGINKSLQEKIFEPYYTTKHKSQGTGLGLYISKLIIEDSLNGCLNMQNNSKGACFFISLKKNETKTVKEE